MVRLQSCMLDMYTVMRFSKQEIDASHLHTIKHKVLSYNVNGFSDMGTRVFISLIARKEFLVDR